MIEMGHGKLKVKFPREIVENAKKGNGIRAPGNSH
jgi:hypothetical protein